MVWHTLEIDLFEMSSKAFNQQSEEEDQLYTIYKSMRLL
jgi:hypothetical protein